MFLAYIITLTIIATPLEDDRLLSDAEDKVVGQFLNVDRGPTAEEIASIFSSAQVGDLIQMVWNRPNGLHTAIIAGFENDGVNFLHSNVKSDANGNRIISNSTYTWTDLQDRYSFDKTGVKGGFTIYRFVGEILPEGSVRINPDNFPDNIFRGMISEKCDKDKDEILSAEEIADVTTLNVSSQYRGIRNIYNLTGIRYFTALEKLYCVNNQLTTLDLSNFTKLKTLYCYNNQLVSLDLSGCSSLEYLWCDNNKLTALNINDCSVLNTLLCDDNQITSLDIPNRSTLVNLYCRKNQLTTLDLSGCSSLVFMGCDNNNLTNLDISGRLSLENLYCEKNQLASLNTSGCALLEYIWCNDNNLTVINLSGCSALNSLRCQNNQLKSIDVSDCASNISVNCDEGVEIIREKIKPSIDTEASLPSAALKKSYSLTLQASGSAPITWKLVSNTTLPDGLKLNKSTGRIYGTPTKEGKFKFKIRATNSKGYVNKTFTLIVGKKPYISTPYELPLGIIGEIYTTTLKASGTKNITWSKVAGTLPSGLKLKASTGKISGTPKKAGIFTFTIMAANDFGQYTKEFMMIIGAKPAISTGATLKIGTKGKTYSTTLKASGTTPLRWTLKSGELPDGLSLGKSSGKISGTPTKEGTFKFKIRAANNYGYVNKTFKLKITNETSSSSVEELDENEETHELKDMTTENQESLNVVENVNISESLNVKAKIDVANYLVAAELPVISVDEEGLYDFTVELSNETPEGAELIYMANSSEPSEDDEIVEFYDEDGAEISTVPASRKIIIAIWLNKNVIYSPVIAVKN